jgi:hypothetical protein
MLGQTQVFTFTETSSSSPRPSPSNPAKFPAIEHDQTTVKSINLPDFATSSRLLPGTLTACSSSCFPTLNTFPIQGKLRQIESKKRLYIQMERNFKKENVMKLAERTIGKSVFVGWPYLNEARISSWVDSTGEIVKVGSQCKKYNHNSKTLEEYASTVYNMEGTLYRDKGVILSPVSLIAKVNPINGNLSYDY